MSLLDSIFAEARRGPERSAIADGQNALSYRELANSAEAIASALLAAGARRGSYVAIAATKSVWTVAATVATWRIGAVHLPLDPSVPAARLESMLRRSTPSVVITDAAAVEEVARACGVEAVWPATALGELARDEATPPWPELDDASPAYCMFTSGSTGMPKGVVLGHGALDAFFAGIVDTHDVSRESRCLNTAPPFFDVTVLDTWFPLSRGAFVRLTSPTDLFPPRLVGILRDEAITHVCMVAPLVKLVAQSGSLLDRVALTSLRSLMTGAESPDSAAVQRWLRAAPGARVLNGYGPTEATCVCVVHAIDAGNAAETHYPIGTEVRGVSWFLDSPEGPTRTTGSEGELLVGGPQLMLGYLGDAEQTAQRTHYVDGAPHYRTGDICRVRPDGKLEFVGRADDEVKVSGYRIHLGEVNGAALSHAGVHDAFTCVLPHASRGAVIALAVRHDPSAPVAEEPLRASLAARLPKYMVPHHIVSLERFPRLASGKPDGSALRREIARLASP